MELKGKTAIVTGSAKGIGRGIAVLLAEQGANIAVNDIDEKEGVETLRLVQEAGAKGIFVKCDVSNRKDVENLFKNAMNKFGSVDILVNNAGIYPFVPFGQMTEEQWDRVIDVNLKGTFYCCKKAAELMPENGRIINISSIASIHGYPALAHYCASKGAINAFTRSLAVGLGSKKITVNAVLPGTVRTPGTAVLGDEQMEAAAKATPSGRVAEPEDIANAVMFFASEKSSQITGQCLVVDGGSTVK